jgi:hypothetical protein
MPTASKVRTALTHEEIAGLIASNPTVIPLKHDPAAVILLCGLAGASLTGLVIGFGFGFGLLHFSWLGFGICVAALGVVALAAGMVPDRWVLQAWLTGWGSAGVRNQSARCEQAEN